MMCVFPFLHHVHKNPITTFYQEWWSALLGVLALSGLLARDYWRQASMPRIAWLPAGLIVVVVLQMALGMIVYVGQGLLYILYLLFAVLMMQLGARLRDELGDEGLALTLAGFLLVGAELGAVLGLLQHYHWHSALDTVVVANKAGTLYGNLAQSNHFANYSAMGLASLGLLYQQRRLPVALVVPAASLLLWVMALSSSRSSWLYLAMMCALAGWGAWRKPEFRRLLVYCLLLLAGFVAANFLVKLAFIGGDHSANTLQRFTGQDAYGGLRRYIWREAWMMFSNAPWLGWGFGQFSWQHFQLGPVLLRSNIAGVFNNAHNLIFQLAAETGLAGLGVLLVTMAAWLRGVFCTQLSLARWWAYAVLGVLAIHSLLEYPLWYAYFLAIAALLLGAFDNARYPLGGRVFGRFIMAAVIVGGGMVLAQLRFSNQQLEMVLAKRSTIVAGANIDIRQTLRELQRTILLKPYADMMLSGYIEPNQTGLEQNLALNTRVLHTFPISSVAYRQVDLLALAGRQQEAKLAWEQAIWSYPKHQLDIERLGAQAEKDPEHFAALLEFALQKEQEYARAVHNQ
ncbi:MAG: Wzy polymerase domain-containing protein [Gallionella sp.]|nr:Wzy polymerase domain-containing protein [Gallionella sp.]